MPTSPTPITALPTPPSRSDPANFAARGDAFLGALPTFATEANAVADNAYSNAVSASNASTVATTQATTAMGYRNDAQAAASTAQTAATTATTKAGEASASAIAASKLNLGDKATPPTTDNQGATLRAGATYYDTTLGKWRVWTGTDWGDGISAVSGVSSVNGRTGDVTMGKSDVGLSNVDNTADSVKVVASAGKLTTARTINGKSFDGTANISISGNPTVTAATGGVMDCSAGDRFTLSVSANTTLSFTNIPAGSYACVLEVLRTAGTITFPAGTVWSGDAPTLAAGRHLFFFDRAQLGTAGWYASALPGYSA